jgi:preprotein translocase subunit Sec63
VKKEASQADIKKTYYQLAKKWHPDTNKDKAAHEKFMEIQEAYDVSCYRCVTQTLLDRTDSDVRLFYNPDLVRRKQTEGV